MTHLRSRPLLVFDGDCGFCTRSVLWLQLRLRRPVRIEPWQYLDLGRVGLDEAMVRRAAWWIEDGLHHEGHLAIARALGACRWPWPLLGWYLRIPPNRWVAAVAYRLVARYRGLLPGTTPACSRPDWPRDDASS
ncbi:MAG: DUF393 domain-containing protein [Acidobacteriota bacterium]